MVKLSRQEAKGELRNERQVFSRVCACMCDSGFKKPFKKKKKSDFRERERRGRNTNDESH